MTIDRFWLPWPVLASARMRNWLLDAGSLTARLTARDPGFNVRLLRQRRMRVAHEEAVVLQLRSGAYALGRDVLLRCGDVPVVFAHSVMRPADVNGPWHAIGRLGTRPLGAALFADPRVTRDPMRYRALRAGHPLYCAATAALGTGSPALWARRSRFVLRGAPLLVTEVFLPRIAEL